MSERRTRLPSEPRVNLTPEPETFEVAATAAWSTQTTFHLSLTIRSSYSEEIAKWSARVDEIPGLVIHDDERDRAEMRAWSWGLRAMSTQIEQNSL